MKACIPAVPSVDDIISTLSVNFVGGITSIPWCASTRTNDQLTYATISSLSAMDVVGSISSPNIISSIPSITTVSTSAAGSDMVTIYIIIRTIRTVHSPGSILSSISTPSTINEVITCQSDYRINTVSSISAITSSASGIIECIPYDISIIAISSSAAASSSLCIKLISTINGISATISI